jgi:glucose/mannose transport system permease protein
MNLRRSVIAPRLALIPASTVAAVAFAASILWTVYLSFTASKRFPDYGFVGWKQYIRLFHDSDWIVALQNTAILGLGSLITIVVGFILAAIIDKEVRLGGAFRTIFLYPLSISLIVTGIVWRWIFNPGLGVESFLHSLGWTSAQFHWLNEPSTVMYGVILGSAWQNTGFFMALMIAGLKSINPDIWRAAKVDGVPFWRLYIEIIIPMMKFTFLTCAILIAINVVKAFDIVVAMTRGGPGTSSYVPAYFTINAYWVRENLGFASASATMMLLMTLAAFVPFAIYRMWRSAAA